MPGVRVVQRPIVARDEAELVQEIMRRGFNPMEVFFKCHLDSPLEPSDLGIWSHHTISTGSLDLEFSHLMALYQVGLANVVMPIAPVRISDSSPTIGYVMERIVGSKLAVIRGTSRLDVRLDTSTQEARENVLRFFSKLGELDRILSRLHDRGLGHGDFAIRNLMMTQDEVPKLIDPRGGNWPDLTQIVPHDVNQSRFITNDKRNMVHFRRLLTEAVRT